MKSRLYVIGNGFDLWHGLPTGYSDFCEYSSDALEESEQFFWFQEDQRAWSDFENDLGTFDWAVFYDVHNHHDLDFNDFKMSYIAGLEDELIQEANRHVDTIRESFVEWVDSIDISLLKPRMHFKANARFITFNYTSTLQQIYGISEDRVLHIHGRAETYDELIFGHGETMKELSLIHI